MAFADVKASDIAHCAAQRSPQPGQNLGSSNLSVMGGHRERDAVDDR
ncbi:hypothetical protein H6F59_13190 [Nodosilinea sp. FACHB-141]|uniref:Uncharacterized protein n=1 Tax=Leptolyngbya subtilissima DQ-A4 TaxID=2933933 RepID=A0ABV0K4X5_9CYAN|nr:hypothetical protein [Nodosilinea sp. FACHB-141]